MLKLSWAVTILTSEDLIKGGGWWWWLGSGGGFSGHPYFFLHISSSYVNIRTHTENQLPILPVSA